MDIERSNKNDKRSWTTSQYEQLLCSLCYYLVYLPMQLTCCGRRICDTCTKSRLDQLSECPFCHEKNPQIVLDKGYKRELERQTLDCPECKWSGSIVDLKTHINDHCNLKCEHCDEMFIFSQQLTKHQQEKCQHRTVTCPLAFLGCSNKVRYDDIGRHYLEEGHQLKLNFFIKRVLPQASRGQSKLTLENSFDPNYHHQITEYLKKMDSLTEYIAPIINNCVRLESERDMIERTIEEKRKQLIKSKESWDNSTKLLENLLQMLSDMTKLLDEIKTKSMTSPKLIELDMTFTWKANFQLLVSNERKLDSETFQTSQSGYLMQLGIDLQTDDQGKKRYLTVSVTILRGEFDAILSWPIPFSISLSIVDLTNTQKHITHPVKSSLDVWGRPINRANKPYQAQLCAIETLFENANRYINDGFIFIRIHMDFNSASLQPISMKEPFRTTQDSIENNIRAPIAMK